MIIIIYEKKLKNSQLLKIKNKKKNEIIQCQN